MFKSNETDCSLGQGSVFVKDIISKCEHVFKCLQCKPSHSVAIIFIHVLNYVLSMHCNMPKFLESFSVLAIGIMRASCRLLKPHGLIIVQINIIAAFCDEYVHRFNTTSSLPIF